MITKLSIANFKSIRQLDLDCKKINLFIGEPNTGKSNILEALALLSWCARLGQESLHDYVRFELMQNLFYDYLLDSEIAVSVSGRVNVDLHIHFRGDQFLFSPPQQKNMPPSRRPRFLSTDYEGKPTGEPYAKTKDIKFFRFRDLARYDDREPGSLKPPSGINLFSAVFGSRILRETMVEFFREYGLKVVMKPQERIFEIQKQVDDLVVGFSYALQSDTLRRVIFYTVAMASNKDSVLVFEEPESNAFPYYTKYLGERIALDETNQFFLATHNPYLLSAIIEKGRKEDVQVFITYFKDYQTKVKPLTPDEVSELMEADPFFNLDRFVEDGQ